MSNPRLASWRGIAAAVVLASLTVPAGAATLLVPSQYVTIQAAIDDAANGDEIVIADGTYTGVGNRDLDPSGLAITIRSANGPATCVIDCELAGRAFFINTNEGPDTQIEGLTLTNASATSLGYAVRCVGTSPTFTDCVFLDNLQGAVRADVGSSPTFIDCRFEGNANAEEGGGAINQSGGTLTLTRCEFDENEAIGFGGAVYLIAEARLLVTDCTFTNNTSATRGGAIYTTDCIDVAFSGCFFQGNEADIFGGGAYVRADSVTVLETVFDSNTVTAEVRIPLDFSLGAGGGLYLSGDTTAVVRDCSFTGNRVSAQVVWGFAMQVASLAEATVSVVGCSFVENMADVVSGKNPGSYGAVYSSPPIEFVSCSFLRNGPGRAIFDQGASAVYGGRVTMVNCLLVDDMVSDAVVSCGDSSSLVNCTVLTDDVAAVTPDGSLTVTNSILRSTGDSVVNEFASVGTVDARYSNLTGGTGPGVIDVDPTFVDAANGDYRLVPGTPGVDAGDNTAVPLDVFDVDDDGDTAELLPLDATGAARFADDGCAPDTGVPGGPPALIDMGAAELTPKITVCDCNMNGTPDDQDISGGTSVDCNGDGSPDECGIAPDCNGNGIPDDCDIADATSDDCDVDGFPDECGFAPDCNGNGVPDSCDITAGTSDDCDGGGVPDECESDCNTNGVPDGCDIASGTSDDCDGGGIPDECEPFADCNTNGVPDTCDLSGGASDDCDANGVPDECETEDCNANGLPDRCDIFSGASQDCNGDGVPNECEDDCNGNGTPDICDPPTFIDESSGPLSPVAGPTTLTFVVSPAPPAASDVTIDFVADADIGQAFETITVRLNGSTIGLLYDDTGADCVASVDSLTLSAAEFNALTSSGAATVAMDPNGGVTGATCADASLAVTVTYTPVVPPAACPGDFDGSGSVGFADLTTLLTQWGGCGKCCPNDIDGSGSVGFADLTALLNAWGPCP